MLAALLYFCKLVAFISIIASMDRENELFRTLLKKHRYSLTPARLQLFRVLQNHNASTIAELTSLLKDFDRATVYRTVELFEKLGIISRVQLGWKYKLELSDIFHHHHHHLSCTNCGRVIVLHEDPTLEQHIKALSKHSGFLPTDHQLEIRGLCQNCQISNSRQ
jgi:Fur family ferric uptake transcriptional regulator